MEGDRAKGTVCVTGGTGYIASWLIMRLLQRGYSVRATVRPYPALKEGKKKDLSFLESLPRAKENLRIFTADLDDPESFTEAIEGCIGVFHLATPMDGEPDQSVMNRQTIDATLGILRASLKSKTVKRVIHTSSVAALVGGSGGTELLDESNWTDIEHSVVAVKGDGPYLTAKTIAEKKALEFGEANDLDVLTIVPPWVVGPFICNKLPLSVEIALAMVFGNEEHYTYLHHMPIVHLDDLASAYIFLFENPNVNGRYICSSDFLTPEKMVGFLSRKYPDQFSVPSMDKVNEFKMYAHFPGLSSKKLLDSGFEFKHGLDEIIDDSIRCCRDKGYL